MKVKQIKQRGEPVWLVDGKIDGKRKRMFFDTKPQAERWLKAEQKDVTEQQWWLNLTNGDRADMMNAFESSRREGFSLIDAVQGHAVFGRGKTHLRKMTLAEAVGHDGVDRRRKDRENQPDPSGFLGDKSVVGMSKHSLSTLKTQLTNFRDYCRGNTQCLAISPELIMSWATDGGVHEKNWELNTRDTYVKSVKNLFNWLIRKDVVKENPVLKMEKIIVDPFDPYVLDVEECRKILKLCHEKHFDVLPLLDLNLFCGIRPSETRRLQTGKNRRDNDFDWVDKEVRFKGRKTKTKMPRVVSMSDNCIAWLNCHADLELPITNANHKWNAFLQDAKKELGYDLWPHDCIRHSFCSYLLRKHEDLGKVALQAGHSESVSMKHYLKLVSKADAEKFWNIYPEDAGTKFQVVAA